MKICLFVSLYTDWFVYVFSVCACARVCLCVSVCVYVRSFDRLFVRLRACLLVLACICVRVFLRVYKCECVPYRISLSHKRAINV